MSRILFVIDDPDWAHGMKTLNIICCLETQFDLEYITQKDQHLDLSFDSNDLILIYYLGQVVQEKALADLCKNNKHKVMIGVCSAPTSLHHASLIAEDIKEFGFGTFCINIDIFNLMKDFIQPCFLTPNGVNTSFFKPPDRRKKDRKELIVGWSGNTATRGRKFRGVDLIQEAVDMTEEALFIMADRAIINRDWEEMRDYYQSLDVYVCASEAEGTPNGPMEASASGLPVITTKVGEMPRFIKHGLNGVFVDRDAEEIAYWLKWFRGRPDRRLMMGDLGRALSRAWDWKIMSQNYAKMFREVLQCSS